MKRLILIVVGLVVMCYSLYFDNSRRQEINKQGLVNLKLHLTGVVESVENGDRFHGYGIIRLKVINSNLQDYDPRSEMKHYFCVIKDGRAEFYDHASTSNTFIGDTLVYDTETKTGAKIKKGISTQSGTISINANDSYYQFIRQKTIFK